MNPAFEYEVVVVDHGSSDRTAAIAQEAGAVVFVRRGGTVASLRNYGVEQSRGGILVFLDADVELTRNWGEHIAHAIGQLEKRTLLITGSHCTVPRNGTWIERYWYGAAAAIPNASHIGTGHMIVSRLAFVAIGGFDQSYTTGEDYEFCARAKCLGGKIVIEPALEVVHHDYPRNLVQFVRREAWHGEGDLRSWREFIGSKVAMVTVAFLLVHALFLVGMFGGGGLLSVGALLLLLGLLLVSSSLKYRGSRVVVIGVNALIFYFYFLGRGLSFLHALKNKD